MALATGRLMMSCLTLPLVMAGRLGSGRVGVVRSSLTREGLVRPLPVLVALRGVVGVVGLVRDARLVLMAPRPTGRRALLLSGRFVMVTRSTVGKAPLLLFVPGSSRIVNFDPTR